MKTCKKCLVNKNFGEFYDSTSKSGIYKMRLCISCYKEKRKFHNRKQSWFSNIYHNAKHRKRALQERFSFDLTQEYIKELFEKQNGKCYWLGISMVIEKDKIPNHPFQPTLDRLDNEIGYIRGNVVLSSMFANLGRKATTIDVFTPLMDQLKKEIKKF